MNSNEWQYISPSKIDNSRRISIPEGVFARNILENPDESREAAGWWSYEKETGVPLLSNEPLEHESYNVIGRYIIGSKYDNHRITVPKPFFDGPEDEPTRSAAQKVDSIARLNTDIKLHFVTRKDMIKSSPRSVYLLPADTLSNMIGKTPNLESNLFRKPI